MRILLFVRLVVNVWIGQQHCSSISDLHLRAFVIVTQFRRRGWLVGLPVACSTLHCRARMHTKVCDTRIVFVLVVSYAHVFHLSLLDLGNGQRLRPLLQHLQRGNRQHQDGPIL